MTWVTCKYCGERRDTSNRFTSPANVELDAKQWRELHESGNCIATADADAAFAANVRLLRDERGWSQSELAERVAARGAIGATQVTISRIEAGKRIVRLTEARALASTFERSLDSMMGGEETNGIRVNPAVLAESRLLLSELQKLLGA